MAAAVQSGPIPLPTRARGSVTSPSADSPRSPAVSSLRDASPDPDKELRARLVASLHRLTMGELRSLISPAQQRALLSRYDGLSDASKLSALRRVRDVLDVAVDDIAKQRQDLMYQAEQKQLRRQRPPDPELLEELDARVEDYTFTLQELATEARSVERRYSQRPRRPAPEPAIPCLSYLFTRELERAKAAAGISATAAGIGEVGQGARSRPAAPSSPLGASAERPSATAGRSSTMPASDGQASP